MLAKSEVEQLIEAGEIAIGYSFLKGTGNRPSFIGEELVNPRKKDAAATLFFENNFFGDRLNLTLGPVVRSHDFTHFKGRKLFKKRLAYFDLRDSNGLFLQPHEVISVATNERITLKGKIGAIILPRLTTVDAGLIYIPTYIDPYWDGILQGAIVNVGSQPLHLELCEEVAICRFYRIDGKVDSKLAEEFPRKSHHFGHNWKKIIDEDEDPLPRRKHPVEMEKKAS